MHLFYFSFFIFYFLAFVLQTVQIKNLKYNNQISETYWLACYHPRLRM